MTPSASGAPHGNDLSGVSGAAFPFRIEDGRVRIASGEQKIRQNMILVLGTRLGERPMLPDFGTRLAGIVHEPNDDVLADIARTHAVETLLRFEPRIAVTGSTVERDADSGVVQLRLSYVHTTGRPGGQAVIPLG
ncbi:hypothetical protein GCM10010156_40770 [Planobispora rosea]|uniref:IraD/Gp25-like domain-containing protein n=1 Tax=Planobispora rosea TaxID=35762 RepID=A0A8J3S953_PLARO|nr:GPW/gp25 family protein [Planobispora rosea]GGS77825.1 hypothetical protein GCM10010156_40770 [Planobispora rosea]GIH85603.1 hypothetical protein Pro02_40110 [Planobispora rosea]